MAGELWNRVHIPFPSAVRTVHVQFETITDVNVKSLLADNENVLKLLRSGILQTEIRVLYELLHILNNSFRGNKAFKVLKQVEQCVNRLKNMKLDDALQELTDLCPNRIQRVLSLQAGEWDVPSQPMLEWVCLKVLGAAQLMTLTMERCKKAFVLSRQLMRWEFVVVNMVITSMLSRLWVIFRGILANLSSLYQHLLKLHRKVANARPMPFLPDFSLPGDMAQFLGPFDTFLLKKKPTDSSHAKDRKVKQQGRKEPSVVKPNNQGKTRKVKEDLGVAVERDLDLDTDMKPFVTAFRNLTEKTDKAEKKLVFNKQTREAATFTDMEKSLKEMILWCESQKMQKEKHLLTFLHLKCQRMKGLEAAGYNLQRKLRIFGQEVCWTLTPQGPMRKTCQSAARRNAHLSTRFHALRRRSKLSTIRSGVKKKQLKRRRRRTELSVIELSENYQTSRIIEEATGQNTDCDGHDDIDDIFASVGF